MKNWIKIGGIAGIILIALTILNIARSYLLLIGATSELGHLNELIFFPDGILSAFLLILLYLGFFFVAKKYNKKFLKIISMLAIIFSLIDFLFEALVNILIYLAPQYLHFLTSQFYTYSYMGLYSIIGILTLLFGIGLMTLRKINKLSFIAGILILADFIIGLIVSGYIFVNQISQIQHAGSMYFISIIYSIFNIAILLLEVIILFRLSRFKTNEKLNRKRKNRKT